MTFFDIITLNNRKKVLHILQHKHRRDGGLQLPLRKKTKKMSNEHTPTDTELRENRNLLLST
jgi:hypothetical protein